MDVAVPAFREKFYICGDYIKHKKYENPYVLSCEKNTQVIPSCFCSDEKVKRDDNLKRARDKVAMLVYANLTLHTKFLTLTCADTVLDVEVFMRRFTSFLQAMKRDGYSLRYLYVLERQTKRGDKEGNIGSLHAHCIVFNDEKIPYEVIKKNWHGGVEIRILDGLKRCKKNKKTAELIRNPAAYVCKYITKDSVAEWCQKTYRCSKGLKKPQEYRINGWLSGDDFFVEKEYEGVAEFFRSISDVIFENSYSYVCMGSYGLKGYQIISERWGVVH